MSPETLLQLITDYKYVIMAPAAAFIGPIASLISGFLLRLGTVDLIPTCIALAGGELTGDVIWYWLGRRYGESFARRFGQYVGITEQTLSQARRTFQRYHDAIIFISKLTGGLGFAPAIFFTAGLSRIHFGRYMALNVLGQIVWTSGLLAVGYFLGHFFITIGNAIERVMSVGLIVIVTLCLIGFGRYLRGQILKSEK